MRSLDRKLYRDLWRMRGQVLSIALVVASGVASYVILKGTWASLERARQAHYEHQHFADVFAHLKRAPSSLAERIELVPGVASVETRIVEEARIPLDTLVEPASAQLISLPSAGRPSLNDIALVRGRLADPSRSEEAVVLESFAAAHGLALEDQIPVVLNGTLRHIRVVGIALSPEFVFPAPMGALYTDERHFAVLWMNEQVLGSAFDMEGAFNDVLVQLQPGTPSLDVRSEIDELLRPYGGLGAIDRSHQPSNFALSGEMAGLEMWASMTPGIFLCVAAFLLHLVLSRLVGLQRPQIAMLSALGIRQRTLALHYAKLVAAIVLLGALAGSAVGIWLGSALTETYTRYFKFPALSYHLDLRVLLTAAGASFAAGAAGAFTSVRRTLRLAPAEAMRPPAPPSYRHSSLETWGIDRLLGTSSRMVLRELRRRPLRFALSAISIAAALATIVLGRFTSDAFHELMDLQFYQAMRDDIAVQFHDPVSQRAALELDHVPGVQHVETMLVLPVRFRNGHRFRDGTLTGYQTDMTLRRVVDNVGRVHPIPRQGLMLTAKLAELLGLGLGDVVQVEIRTGDRRTLWLAVETLVDEPVGLQAHMSLERLCTLLDEPLSVSTALLSIDATQYELIEQRLTEYPDVVATTSRQAALEQFRRQSADWMAVMTLVLTVLATTVTIGVVYNNARIALSMRGRDFASLRVLGYTRAEISRVLYGELAIPIMVALVPGLVMGRWMCEMMLSFFDPEQYRLPLSLSAQSYAFAIGVTIAAGFVSALLVRRHINRLDLIGVLKSRE